MKILGSYGGIGALIKALLFFSLSLIQLSTSLEHGIGRSSHLT